MKINEFQALSEVEKALNTPQELFRILFTGKRKGFNPEYRRIEMRPVMVKGGLLISVSKKSETQDFTENHAVSDVEWRNFWALGFSHILIETSSLSTEYRLIKSGEVISSSQKINKEINFNHDKKKKRVLDPRDLYLHKVGITDSEGNVKRGMADKLRQVEEFLRLLEPLITQWRDKNPNNIFTAVDCGSGSGYLTFALQRYLDSQGIEHRVLGLEIRPELVTASNEIAHHLGIENSIEFKEMSIDQYRKMHDSQSGAEEISLLMALHACDTATDEALALGIESGASLIVVSPCCHHDLQRQITQQMKLSKLQSSSGSGGEMVPIAFSDPAWSTFLADGIVTQRFTDLLTDLIRKEIISSYGYNSEIIEYIGEAHTARNLMMRSVKRAGKVERENLGEEKSLDSQTSSSAPASSENYRRLLTLWGVKPALAQMLNFH